MDQDTQQFASEGREEEEMDVGNAFDMLGCVFLSNAIYYMDKFTNSWIT